MNRLSSVMVSLVLTLSVSVAGQPSNPFSAVGPASNQRSGTIQAGGGPQGFGPAVGFVFERGTALPVRDFNTDAHDLLLYFDGDDCQGGMLLAHGESPMQFQGQGVEGIPLTPALVGQEFSLQGEDGRTYTVRVLSVAPSTHQAILGGAVASVSFTWQESASAAVNLGARTVTLQVGNGAPQVGYSFVTGSTLSVSNFTADEYDLLLYFDGDDCAGGALIAYDENPMLLQGTEHEVVPLTEALEGQSVIFPGKSGEIRTIHVLDVVPSTFEAVMGGSTASITFSW